MMILLVMKKLSRRIRILVAGLLSNTSLSSVHCWWDLGYILISLLSVLMVQVIEITTSAWNHWVCPITQTSCWTLRSSRGRFVSARERNRRLEGLDIPAGDPRKAAAAVVVFFMTKPQLGKMTCEILGIPGTWFEGVKIHFEISLELASASWHKMVCSAKNKVGAYLHA